MLLTSKQLYFAATELQFLLSRLISRQNMNILIRICMNLKIHAFNIDTSKVSLNLKIHAYNLETGIAGNKGATIFVIALKI